MPWRTKSVCNARGVARLGWCRLIEQAIAESLGRAAGAGLLQKINQIRTAYLWVRSLSGGLLAPGVLIVVLRMAEPIFFECSAGDRVAHLIALFDRRRKAAKLRIAC